MIEVDEAPALAAELVGKTIESVRFRIEGPPPGFEGSPPDIEGVELIFTDGVKASFGALGWHDIQSLVVNVERPATKGDTDATE